MPSTEPDYSHTDAFVQGYERARDDAYERVASLERAMNDACDAVQDAPLDDLPTCIAAFETARLAYRAAWRASLGLPAERSPETHEPVAAAALESGASCLGSTDVEQVAGHASDIAVAVDAFGVHNGKGAHEGADSINLGSGASRGEPGLGHGNGTPMCGSARGAFLPPRESLPSQDGSPLREGGPHVPEPLLVGSGAVVHPLASDDPLVGRYACVACAVVFAEGDRPALIGGELVHDTCSQGATPSAQPEPAPSSGDGVGDGVAVEAASPSDAFTLRFSHRVLMRRVHDGEEPGDLHYLVAELVREGVLARDAAGVLELTGEGLNALNAWVRLGETRRTERPRLTSKPFPPRWRIVQTLEAHNSQYEHTDPDVRCTVQTWDDQVAPLWVGARNAYAMSAAKLAAIARDVAAIVEWDAHERAVAAQDGAR